MSFTVLPLKIPFLLASKIAFLMAVFSSSDKLPFFIWTILLAGWANSLLPVTLLLSLSAEDTS